MRNYTEKMFLQMFSFTWHFCLPFLSADSAYERDRNWNFDSRSTQDIFQPITLSNGCFFLTFSNFNKSSIDSFNIRRWWPGSCCYTFNVVFKHISISFTVIEKNSYRNDDVRQSLASLPNMTRKSEYVIQEW